MTADMILSRLEVASIDLWAQNWKEPCLVKITAAKQSLRISNESPRKSALNPKLSPLYTSTHVLLVKTDLSDDPHSQKRKDAVLKKETTFTCY